MKTEDCRKLFATIQPYVTLGGRNHDSRKVDSESDQLGGDSKHRKTSDRPGKKNDKTKSSDKFQKKDKEAKHSPTKSIRTNDRNTSNPDCDNCGNKHKDAKTGSDPGRCRYKDHEDANHKGPWKYSKVGKKYAELRPDRPSLDFRHSLTLTVRN